MTTLLLDAMVIIDRLYTYLLGGRQLMDYGFGTVTMPQPFI